MEKGRLREEPKDTFTETFLRAWKTIKKIKKEMIKINI